MQIWADGPRIMTKERLPYAFFKDQKSETGKNLTMIFEARP